MKNAVKIKCEKNLSILVIGGCVCKNVFNFNSFVLPSVWFYIFQHFCYSIDVFQGDLIGRIFAYILDELWAIMY
jgi:hypothetical protein